jgi:hypothetical protein
LAVVAELNLGIALVLSRQVVVPGRTAEARWWVLLHRNGDDRSGCAAAVRGVGFTDDLLRVADRDDAVQLIGLDHPYHGA